MGNWVMGGFFLFSFFYSIHFVKRKKINKQQKQTLLVWLVFSFLIFSNMFGPIALANDQQGLVPEAKTALKNQTQSLKILTKKKTTKVKKASQLISESQRQKSNEELAQLEYQGTQTIEINGNQPTFTKKALSLDNKAWEEYGALDDLNRATYAEAMLNQSLMPTKKRGDISKVKPTGWKNKKLDTGYLYNRSHLIGYALSGENANWKNLITGTAQLNSPEMLRFEMDMKTYLEKSPKNYVRYCVTPVFRREELLARGVHLMAQSIDSDAIAFNVYIFNVQEGVTLNYADGSSETAKEAQEKIAAAEQAEADRLAEEERIQAEQLAQEQAEANRVAAEQQAVQVIEQTVYVAPQSGTKYHFSSTCRGLKQANSVVEISLTEAQNQGYTLCGWED